MRVHGIERVIVMSLQPFELIKERAENLGLRIFRGTLYRSEEQSQIDIQAYYDNDPIGVFFDIILQLEQKFFFIDLTEYDREALDSYLVEESSIAKEDYGDIYKEIQLVIEKHNKYISKLPDYMIGGYELFTYVDGIVYSLELHDDWERNLRDVGEIIRQIKEEHQEELGKIALEKAKLQEGRKKQIASKLLADEVFSNCTNKASRFNYCLEILENEGLAIDDIGLGSGGAIEEWLDVLWAKLKSTKRK